MSHAVNSIVTEEIDRFNKLADSWWDEAGPMWPLHRLNALRAPFINGHIRRHFELVLPKGTHQWRKFVKPVEIEDILNQQEYQLIETTGVAVNPLGRSMSLSRYLGGNYMLVATRCPSL